MKSVQRTTKFKKDYKQYVNNSKVSKRLEEALYYLVNDLSLPSDFKNHPLKGNYKGFYDCHLLPDVVLIYKIENNSISLTRIGKHNKLELTEMLKLHIKEL